MGGVSFQYVSAPMSQLNQYKNGEIINMMYYFTMCYFPHTQNYINNNKNETIQLNDINYFLKQVLNQSCTTASLIYWLLNMFH